MIVCGYQLILSTSTEIKFHLDIHSLKETTLLPLLYPEVFQQFSVTPPRGVLFHGPPGTGKTLLACALAASCHTNGKQICMSPSIPSSQAFLISPPTHPAFFMRKGTSCLSKWVGETECQLGLLFEEARNCQPSIIFFDEIDASGKIPSYVALPMNYLSYIALGFTCVAPHSLGSSGSNSRTLCRPGSFR
jgi:ATPase family associated with various cellular activities (AAA)